MAQLVGSGICPLMHLLEDPGKLEVAMRPEALGLALSCGWEAEASGGAGVGAWFLGGVGGWGGRIEHKSLVGPGGSLVGQGPVIREATWL